MNPESRQFSKQALQEFYQSLFSKDSLKLWHKVYTPWASDQQIDQFIDRYDAQIKEIKKRLEGKDQSLEQSKDQKIQIKDQKIQTPQDFDQEMSNQIEKVLDEEFEQNKKLYACYQNNKLQEECKK